LITNVVQVYRTRAKVVSSKPIFNAGTERFMRDWRSGIVTITVRDQRMRQHDPILGVVPLKLADVLQTSSQVTRWYPLDGGIGFGRVRISVLFRSIETRLPPQQLGWDVGTFEFTSKKILATGYSANAKLKMRTGGSSGKIARNQCEKTEEGDGVFWDLVKDDSKNLVRLPVKYRYRSPIVFELHTSGKRAADAYAVVWLHHLEDNKEESINIPIWKTDKGMRLVQNYITEENFRDIPDIKIEEVGRLQFMGRFKTGTDHDHASFVSDNDSRETQETWEACHAEGVRTTKVTKELPPAAQKLHEQSLTKGRDVLANADEDEKKKWLSKTGEDWSGAFGEDPALYVNGKGGRKPDYSREERSQHSGDDDDEEADYTDSDSTSDESDLGLRDASTNQESDSGETRPAGEPIDVNATNTGTSQSKNPVTQYKDYKENSKGLHRKQRGLMQWKPIRNLAFAKDEAKFMVKKTLKKGTLAGRQPDVETETGT